eukprot:scaffold26813_cov39-Phaeocystis_antarctica.AAC.2
MIREARRMRSSFTRRSRRSVRMRRNVPVPEASASASAQAIPTIDPQTIGLPDTPVTSKCKYMLPCD